MLSRRLLLALGALAPVGVRREPDDRIGYTILAYRLTDAEVSAALTGPLP